MNGTMTMLDIAISSGIEAELGLIDEAHRAAPELSGMSEVMGKTVQIPTVGLSRTIEGVTYKTKVRTAVPTPPFRDGNEGTAATGGNYENREVSTHAMNPWWNADVVIADRHPDGPQSFMYDEAMSNLEGAFQTIGRQFYTGNDAKGHPGLSSVILDSMTVDAAGSTANTGSSVWLVRWGERDVRWAYGNNGEFRITDVRIGDVYPSAGKRYSAYIQELFVYPGLQIFRPQAVGRIKRLTEDDGKGLTAARLRKAVSNFPANRPPTAIHLTKRSLRQYADSLTGYDGKGTPPPTPDNFEGIPFVVTENISNTESVA